jgi:Mg-chelatase subunit ChlD
VTTSISGQGNITGTRLAAHAVLTLDRSGSMDPDYYAGTPLDVALVLDRSGSMEFLGTDPEQPMTDAKTAAKVFMDNLVSNAQVGVVSFASDHRVDIGLTLLNSSDGKALVRNAIDGIYATGGTAIGDGLADANNMLIGGRVDARKITILLTDGVC